MLNDRFLCIGLVDVIEVLITEMSTAPPDLGET